MESSIHPTPYAVVTMLWYVILAFVFVLFCFFNFQRDWGKKMLDFVYQQKYQITETFIHPVTYEPKNKSTRAVCLHLRTPAKALLFIPRAPRRLSVTGPARDDHTRPLAAFPGVGPFPRHLCTVTRCYSSSLSFSHNHSKASGKRRIPSTERR